MKLTNALKKAFVNAVMADVPKIDYNEQAHTLAQQYVLSIAPQAVVDLYNSPNRDYLAADRVCFPAYIADAHLYAAISSDVLMMDDEVWNQLRELSNAAEAQNNKLFALREQLHAAVASCTTVAALKKLLPEFEKYLPSAPPTNQYPVAVTGVVSEFVKAGWPKK